MWSLERMAIADHLTVVPFSRAMVPARSRARHIHRVRMFLTMLLQEMRRMTRSRSSVTPSIKVGRDRYNCINRKGIDPRPVNYVSLEEALRALV